MAESKISATHRLQKDGRWDEASQFRDKIRLQLRKEGLTRADANEAAWQRMIEKFPPTVNPLMQAQGIADLELASELLRETSTAVVQEAIGIALWACRSLGVSNVAQDDAPSVAAWQLLVWARENEGRLLSEIVPKLLTLSDAVTKAIELAEFDLEVFGFETGVDWESGDTCDDCSEGTLT